MNTSPFVIAVRDLEPGVRKPIAFEATVDWAVGDSRIVSPIRADIGLDAHSGGVMVSGTTAADVTHVCNRCLVEFSEPVAVHVAQDFVSESAEDEYRVVNAEVDTEPLLRDELLLAVPLVPVCRETCLGLCPECGTDLNTEACSGHEAESVSPFAELRSLFDQE